MAANEIQYPLINGVRHSFPSIELKLAGITTIGFKSLNYNWKVTRTKVMGNHGDPIATTRGTAEYSCDFELYLAEFQNLLSTLGPGFAEKPFSIMCSYLENGFDTIQDQILGCRLMSGDASQGQGPDPLVRKVEVDVMKILPNGVDCWLAPLKGVSA